MTTATATKTRHVLLAVRNGQPEIVQVFGRVDQAGAWGQAIDRHAELSAEAEANGIRARELHYAVRDSDHPLVQDAAKAEASKLGARQAAVLRTFAEATAAHNWVKPGSRKSEIERGRWDRAAQRTGLEKAWDYTGVARALQAKGLLIIRQEVAYSPATYAMTARGRLVAAAI